MSDKKIHPYFVTDSPGEWAMLVFHYDRQKAKVLGWQNWPAFDAFYTDVRVWRASDDYMIFAESEDPHVIDTWYRSEDDPLTECETWEDALKIEILTQLERKIIAKFGKQGDKKIRKIIKNQSTQETNGYEKGQMYLFLAINALKTGKIKNLL